MPFFRTSGGSFLEIDLPDPANTHAVERHDYMVSVGELTLIPAESVEWVDAGDGAKKLVAKTPAPEPEPAPRRKLVAKTPTVTDDSLVEIKE